MFYDFVIPFLNFTQTVLDVEDNVYFIFYFFFGNLNFVKANTCHNNTTASSIKKPCKFHGVKFRNQSGYMQNYRINGRADYITSRIQ